jgi:hypothetical protein
MGERNLNKRVCLFDENTLRMQSQVTLNQVECSGPVTSKHEASPVNGDWRKPVRAQYPQYPSCRRRQCNHLGSGRFYIGGGIVARILNNKEVEPY